MRVRGTFLLFLFVVGAIPLFATASRASSTACADQFAFDWRVDTERVIEAVRKTFPLLKNDPEVLPTLWRLENERSQVASTGFCFAAANAAYHLLGGKAAGLTPMVATYYDPELERLDPQSKGRATHWWVKTQDGTIIDPTADQYTALGEEPPYALGRGAGFNRPLTVPTKAGLKIMVLALKLLEN